VDADSLANPSIESFPIRLKTSAAKSNPNAGLVLVLTLLRTDFAVRLRVVKETKSLGLKLQDSLDFQRLTIQRCKLGQHFIHGAMGCHAV